MKNFERKDKNERRRVLLSKNYELSNSLDNEKLLKGGKSTPAGEDSFVHTDGAVLRETLTKHIYAVIALFVAICVLIPGIAIGIHALAENSTASVHGNKEVEEVVTKKTAEPNGDGTYHVTIEAYNTAYSLYNPPTDSVLVLERSSKMADILYTRDKTNLMTNTIFSGSEMDSNNALFDVDNPSNIYLKIFGQEIKFAIISF